jgi:hypothetical protein
MEICNSFVLRFIDLFRSELPPPECFVKILKDIVGYAVAQWSRKFGGIYKQLRILEIEMRGTDPPKDLRVEGLSLLTEMLEKRSDQLLSEVGLLIGLLIMPDSDNPSSRYCTEEYKSIVLENMRERRIPLRAIFQEADRLKMFAETYSTCEALLPRIEMVSQKASVVEQEAIRLGMDDDEFVDVETSDEADSA